MSLIITNDDGVDSPYLNALADRLEHDFGDRVLVIAPEKQRSATSHTITLHKPLRVTEVAPRRFSASGTPVDCVYLGLVRLAPQPVELVISGINDGHNLGTDVFYSGTVGGAVEGGLRGVPSMAVSMAPEGAPRSAPRGAPLLDRVTDLCARLARELLDGKLPPPKILNVNIPDPWTGAVRWTRLGRRYYEDDVHERTDPRGRNYYWIGGGIAGSDEAPGSDGEAIRDGVASLTPLALDLTCETFLSDGPRWPAPTDD